MVFTILGIAVMLVATIGLIIATIVEWRDWKLGLSELRRRETQIEHDERILPARQKPQPSLAQNREPPTNERRRAS